MAEAAGLFCALACNRATALRSLRIEHRAFSLRAVRRQPRRAANGLSAQMAKHA